MSLYTKKSEKLEQDHIFTYWEKLFKEEMKLNPFYPSLVKIWHKSIENPKRL